MKKVLFVFLYSLMIDGYAQAQIGNVGINTTTPSAMLHVKDSSVLFTGINPPPGTGNPPVSGAGTRMMWYPNKAAFRAGNVTGTQWDKVNIGLYSIAFGVNTKAIGTSSTAMGQTTTASGTNSTAMGDGTTASGTNSAAMGTSTTASGFSSTAMGQGTLASSFYSTAMGQGTTASGNTSTAMGSSTTASGNTSTAMGSLTTASGDASTVMGSNTKAKPFASVVLGQYNDTSSISSNTWNLLDPVFIIGNGVNVNTRSNAMTVLKNGKTGINIENPLAGLHIKGIESTFDAHIRLETAGGGTDYANILYDGNMKFKTFTAGDEYQWRNSANTTNMTLQDDGDLYIDGNIGIGTTSPAAKLEVIGTTILGTNGTALTEIIKLTVAKDVASVPLNGQLLVDFAVANCAIASAVYVSPELDLANGLIIAHARVSSAGIVKVNFTNTTGAAIDPANMNYYITVIR